MQDQHQMNKQHLWDFWRAFPAADLHEAQQVAARYLHEQMTWNGPHPMNHLGGLGAFVDDFWKPLKRAVPDVRRETHILIGGDFEGQSWVSATGQFVGTFARPWLTIPPHHREVRINFGDFWRVYDGKIMECYMIIDLVDVMQQAGYAVLPRSAGQVGQFPPPLAKDGVRLAPYDEEASRTSLELVEAMIAGLLSYDGETLESMGMMSFWDNENMRWYGPAGIGATYGLHEFEQYHQIPFLTAFPDRHGGNHAARVADGQYVGSAGWPSLWATHAGPYLGLDATQRPITMRVMDWWKREGERLTENWVLIDMVDLFRQLDVDLFERMHQQIADEQAR